MIKQIEREKAIEKNENVIDSEKKIERWRIAREIEKQVGREKAIEGNKKRERKSD